MLALKNLLPKAMNRAGISTQVRATQVLQAVESFLDAAMLAELRMGTRVISFAFGTLKIHCPNSIAAHEVGSLQPGIIEAATTADPRCEIRRVLVSVHPLTGYDV